MRVSTRLLASAALAIVVSGCSTLDMPISKDAASRIKRVAVVSLTGDTFIIQHTGFTVFGNKREQKDIAPWALDSHYEAQAAKALDALGGFAVVQVKREGTDLSRLIAGRAKDAEYPNGASIGKSAQALCAANSLDALFLVAGGSPGVYSQITKPTRLVRYLQISLIDCVTGRPLAIQQVGRPTTTQWGGTFRAPLVDELPPSLSPREGWSPEVSEEIRKRLIDMPAPAWQATIAAMLPKTQ